MPQRRLVSPPAVPVLVAALLLAGAPARAADTLREPTFIDPARRFDKPEIGPGRVLRFLTTDDEPPFNFKGPDGTPAGFNVDLARALCAALSVTCSVQTRSFEALLPALRNREGDAVAASLAISAAARAEADLTLPTIRMAARFAARSGSVPATVLPETVGHSVVGVQAGTAHEAYLRRFFPRAVVRTFTDPDALRTALKGGAVDLVFADGLATALWLNGSASEGCCGFAGGPFTEPAYFGEGAGLALRKGDAPLRDALDFALQRLTADGTVTNLYLKWFPVGFF